MDFSYMTAERIPETLYHYTSLESLLAIVQTKRLRASNIRFLNDTSESQRLKQDVVSILRKRTVDSREAKIFTELIKMLDSRPQQSNFVASLSEKGDLLSQWRAYCPSGAGVSIGFDSVCLQEQWILNPRAKEPLFLSAPLQKVRYYGHSTRMT